MGQPLPRREDAALLRGQGRFIDDHAPPGCLHLAFLRSPLARGRLAGLDCAAARERPGVVAVLTAPDMRDLGRLPVNPIGGPVNPPPFPVLAEHSVQALGQPVAAVVAETLSAALDALEQIDLDIEPLPALLTPTAALEGDSLYPEVPGNLALGRHYSLGDARAAFDAAAVVVEAQIRHPRLAPSSLEPRATLAQWDAEAARLTLWSGTQTPHRLRSDIAAILGLDLQQVQAIAPDVGGAFGLKASLYPEDVVVAQAARLLGRPVKWVAGRGEELLSGTHGRGAESRGALALDWEGRMLALDADFLFPLGYWMPFSAAVPAWNAARILPGPYAVADYSVTSRAVVTNTAPLGIYRGAGRPEAALLLERLVEEAADRLGMDPLELRRRNLAPTQAGDGASGRDSSDYQALMAELAAQSNYEKLRTDVAQRRHRGEKVGLGLCCYVEPSGQGWESARVGLLPEGRIRAATGSSAQGQGRETAFAQIVAQVFEVAPERVEVLHGDTARTPAGIGALASRSTPIGGSALLLAAGSSREQACRQAAALLGCAPEAVRTDEAGLHSSDREAHVSWTELARKSNDACESEIVYEAAGEAWGFGACLAVAAVDQETGAARIERLVYLDDAGTLVNPLLAEGQIHGGIAQGLGEALLERLVYNEEGELLTGSLMDYALPRANDMPALQLGHHSTPSPCNPLGARGLGESGTIGAPPAILNALLDALKPGKLAILEPPLSSETLWRALRKEQE